MANPDTAHAARRSYVLRISSWPGRGARARTSLTELRESLVTMAAALAAFGCAVVIEHRADQGVDLGILAVALAVMLARGERRRRSSSLPLTVAVLCASAFAADEVAQLMGRGDHAGDALLVVALAAAIWMRRFGSTWTKAGSVLTLPFVAALVAPSPPQGGLEHDGWWAAIAAIVVACVVLTAWLARRTGFLARPDAPSETPPRPQATAADGATSRPRLAPSTRMAVQMAAALGAAFVVGREAFSEHWSWPVLTAFIVGSANRGRADVVYKSVLRTAGAVAGTAAATGLSNQFAAGDDMFVVLIFAVLGIGTWLRWFNYAYWAACMTAALALLYGYFGQSGGDLLSQRLQGILAGAACGVLAAWLVLPVRTSDVLRRRTSNLLTSLAELLSAVRDRPAGIGRQHAVRVLVAIGALDQLAEPLRARRWLARRRPSQAWPADLVDAADECAAPARTIVRHAAQRPDLLADPRVRAASDVTLGNVVAVRDALRSASAPDLDALARWTANGHDEAVLLRVHEAIEAVNAGVEAIARGLAAGGGARRRAPG
jgi:hypothetical protein